MDEQEKNESLAQIFGAKLFLVMNSWPQIDPNLEVRAEVRHGLIHEKMEVSDERFNLLCEMTLKEYYNFKKEIYGT